MTTRDIAVKLCGGYHMNVTERRALNALVSKVRNVLGRQKGDVLRSERQDDVVVWAAR